MTRLISLPFILATVTLLCACDGSKPAAGGNVTMRDMEVVDGTANDSMTDLDNATTDGTLLANAGLANAGLANTGATRGLGAVGGNAAVTNGATPKDTAAANSGAAE